MTPMARMTPTSTTVIRRYAIEGVEPVSMEYSDIRFLPTAAVIEFTDDEPQWVILSGPNVKKNNATGQNTHERSYSLTWKRGREAPPEWVEPLLDPEAVEQ